MIAIDTNVLVYAHREGTAEHESAFEVLSEAVQRPEGAGIALASIAEYWSVVTDSRHPGGASSNAAAVAFIDYLLKEWSMTIWTPSAGFGERLMRWASSLRVKGTRIFDLQIAVTCIEHGAREIWTYDRHFTAPPGIRVKHLKS